MELSQLKKEIHAYVDGVDDEKTLLAVAEVLERYVPAIENRDYEHSVEFWNGINKARRSIAEGRGISDTEARKIINNKILAGE